MVEGVAEMIQVHKLGLGSRSTSDRTTGALWYGLHAVFAYQLLGLWIKVGQAGRPNWFAFGFLLCKFKIQAKEEGQRVFAFLHAIGSADGGAEGGVGAAEAVRAAGFGGALEFAQGPALGGHNLAAQGRMGQVILNNMSGCFDGFLQVHLQSFEFLGLFLNKAGNRAR